MAHTSRILRCVRHPGTNLTNKLVATVNLFVIHRGVAAQEKTTVRKALTVATSSGPTDNIHLTASERNRQPGFYRSEQRSADFVLSEVGGFCIEPHK